MHKPTSSKQETRKKITDKILPPLMDGIEQHTLARMPITNDRLRQIIDGALAREEIDEDEPTHESEKADEYPIHMVVDPAQVKADPDLIPGKITYIPSDSFARQYVLDTLHDWLQNWNLVKDVPRAVNSFDGHLGRQYVYSASPMQANVHPLPTSDTITEQFRKQLQGVLYRNVMANFQPTVTAFPDELINDLTQKVIDLLMDFEPTKPHTARETMAKVQLKPMTPNDLRLQRESLQNAMTYSLRHGVPTDKITATEAALGIKNNAVHSSLLKPVIKK